MISLLGGRALSLGIPLDIELIRLANNRNFIWEMGNIGRIDTCQRLRTSWPDGKPVLFVVGSFLTGNTALPEKFAAGYSGSDDASPTAHYHRAESQTTERDPTQ